MILSQRPEAASLHAILFGGVRCNQQGADTGSSVHLTEPGRLCRNLVADRRVESS